MVSAVHRFRTAVPSTTALLNSKEDVLLKGEIPQTDAQDPTEERCSPMLVKTSAFARLTLFISEQTSAPNNIISGAQMLIQLNECHLEFEMFRRSRARDDVSDVGHAGNEHQQALEAHAESSMRDGTKPTQIHVPPVVFF